MNNIIFKAGYAPHHLCNHINANSHIFIYPYNIETNKMVNDYTYCTLCLSNRRNTQYSLNDIQDFLDNFYNYMNEFKITSIYLPTNLVISSGLLKLLSIAKIFNLDIYNKENIEIKDFYSLSSDSDLEFFTTVSTVLFLNKKLTKFKPNLISFVKENIKLFLIDSNYQFSLARNYKEFLRSFIFLNNFNDKNTYELNNIKEFYFAILNQYYAKFQEYLYIGIEEINKYSESSETSLNRDLNTFIADMNIEFYLKNTSRKKFIDFENLLKALTDNYLIWNNSVINKNALTFMDKYYNKEKFKYYNQLKDLFFKFLKNNLHRDLELFMFSILKLYKDDFYWDKVDEYTLKTYFNSGIDLENFKLDPIKSKYYYYIFSFSKNEKDIVTTMYANTRAMSYILLVDENEYRETLPILVRTFCVFLSEKIKSTNTQFNYIMRDCLYLFTELINKERTYDFFYHVAKYIDLINNRKLTKKFLIFIYQLEIEECLGDLKNYSPKFKSILMNLKLNKEVR